MIPLEMQEAQTKGYAAIYKTHLRKTELDLFAKQGCTDTRN